jgi:hemoglobin
VAEGARVIVSLAVTVTWPEESTPMETAAPVASLYQRIGGAETLRRIASDLVDAHAVNPVIAPRFQAIDKQTAKQHAFEFFCMGTGGSEPYTGRDLRAVHTGMNASEQEFVAAVDDLMAVMQRNGVGEREQQEVLFIFFSLKGDVLRI